MKTIQEILTEASEKTDWSEESRLDKVIEYLQRMADNNPSILDDFKSEMEEAVSWELSL